MKGLACGLTLLAAASLAALPARAAEQAPRVEGAPVSLQSAGVSLGAAFTNTIYFPLRFVVTAVTAEAGGFTGWLTGGNQAAAQSVWDSTDGQAFVTPEMLQRREPLQFGPYEF